MPLDENDREILRMISRKKAIILLNKSDLEPVLESKELEKICECPHPVHFRQGKRRAGGAGGQDPGDVFPGRYFF